MGQGRFELQIFAFPRIQDIIEVTQETLWGGTYRVQWNMGRDRNTEPSFFLFPCQRKFVCKRFPMTRQFAFDRN